MWLSSIAASRLWAAVTACMSPVRCRLSASMGTTWLYPPPAAPPLMPNVGPIDGCLIATVARFPMCLNPCPRPTVVVVLPSPSGVGVIALTTTYLAAGWLASSAMASSLIFITSSPCGSSRREGMPIASATSSSGFRAAPRAISRSLGKTMVLLFPNPQTQIPGRRKPSTPMPSDSPALTSAPNRYWPDDRSQCSRYEGTPARSSLMMSVATPATGARSAAPSGAMSSCRSAPHSRAISSAASVPVIRISARPWVRSTTLTNSSGAESAATVSSQPPTAAAAAAPGGASTSHSPGPEPTTSQPPSGFRGDAGRSSPPEPAEPGPASSRPQRPNGTPSALAIAPFHGARRWTLASGVQSVIVSAASLRAPLTSQPASTRTGGAGAIGLRATATPSANCSDTHPAPFGIHVGEVFHHPGADQPAARQPHRDPGPGRGQRSLDLRQADRAAEGGRHPARGHAAGDPRPVDDLARLGRHHRAVLRLQPDQPGAGQAILLVLPGQLGLAQEVVLVELDRPVKPRAEAAGQAVGVLADDKVALLKAQDALGLHPERRDPEVGAAVHQRLPDVQPVPGRDVQLVRQLAGEADPPQHAPVHPGDPR